MKGQILELNPDGTGMVSLENGENVNFDNTNLKPRTIFNEGDKIVVNFSNGILGTMIKVEG